MKERKMDMELVMQWIAMDKMTTIHAVSYELRECQYLIHCHIIKWKVNQTHRSGQFD